MSGQNKSHIFAGVIPAGLKSSRPGGAVRAMLILEVALFMATAACCLWLTPRDRPLQWYHAGMWGLAVALPIFANLLHGDRPADSGLRVDNLISSSREALVVTLVLGAVVVAIGLAAAGWRPIEWHRIACDAAPIFAFAVVQQYAMQSFVLRRLRQSGVRTPLAVAITVMCFGLMHMPNPVLTAGTIAVAIPWCILFVRRPNLIALSASHCMLTLLVRSFWPKAWHLGLAVGPRVLERAHEHGWW